MDSNFIHKAQISLTLFGVLPNQIVVKIRMTAADQPLLVHTQGQYPTLLAFYLLELYICICI